jgi:hypothetical protein
MTQHTITYDDARREALLDVIRRLNSNPYSLTKSECISEIESMLEAAPKPRTASRTALSEGPVKPVARLHITSTDTYPDIEVEVLDGSTLQPEMSPVNIYTAPPASRTVPSDAEILQVFADITGLADFVCDLDALRIGRALLSRYGQPATRVKPVAVISSVVEPGPKGVRIKWLGTFPQIGDKLYAAPVAAQTQPTIKESSIVARAQPVVNQSLTTEREAFETCCLARGYERRDLTRLPDGYYVSSITYMWNGWQARAALAQQEKTNG